MPFAQDGTKTYRLNHSLGHLHRYTLDAEGEETATAMCARITPADIEAALPAFVGEVEQIPPAFSGPSASMASAPMHLARAGETVEL